MKFFILGDSWGIGEWQTIDGLTTCVPNSGVDYYLGQSGHTITNVSAGSASNFGQLRHAYWTLKKQSDYDYIIWFHTEPSRDIVEHVIDDPIDGPLQYPDFKKIKNYHDAMSYINERNYIYAQETIYNEFNIPFIVIGGVGRLEDCIDNYSFAVHKIYSWTEELLDLSYRLPRSILQTQRWIEIFSTANYDKQQVLDEMIKVENYQNLLKTSPLFPDNAHVIRTEYEKLAHRLLEMVK